MIVDGHEDLALNVLADGREYLTSAQKIREVEAAAGIESANGVCMLGYDDWRAADVRVIVATIQAIPREHAQLGEPSYVTAEAAYRQARAQLEIYRDWDARGSGIRIVETRALLDELLTDSARPIGLVLLMENADSIRDIDELSWWWAQGLRFIGPAWHTNRYSGSAMSGGPLTDDGRQLLDEMSRIGFVLDVTHMSDESAREALDRYDGVVVATHANARRTVELDRLLADDVVREIAVRDGVIGVLPLTWALDRQWKAKGKNGVTLASVVDAIDDLRELTGSTRHIAIGTDFDGGQGAEAAPAELDTIADLPKLADELDGHDYSRADINAIMSGNWLRVLGRALPSRQPDDTTQIT
jgi:membrane dipeptidase